MGLIRGTWPLNGGHFLLDVIRELGFCNMQTGPFIGGGAVRRIIGGDPRSNGFDIDIFTSTFESGRGLSPLEIAAVLTKRPETVVRSTALGDGGIINHINFVMRRQWHLQVIYDRVYATPEALIDSMDYTVCMAVTDGWSWLADERLLSHLYSMTLSMHRSNPGKHAATRLGKYCSYGFTPEPGVLTNVLNLGDPALAKSFTHGVMPVPIGDY